MSEYLRPPPSLEDGLAEVHDELTLWSSRFGALLLETLELRPGIAGLDIGCATGFPLIELASVHGPSCRFTGIDLWQTALAQARRKLAFRHIDTVALAAADGAALPFAERSFDLITVSNLGINNFERPAAVLAECRRVARPGARLAVTTNLAGHFGELYGVLREVLAARGAQESLERLAVNEGHRGTRESVVRLIEEGGFRVRRQVERTFHLRYLDGGALLRHPLTVWFLGGWRRAVEGLDETEVFGELEARLDQLARGAGELRMSVPALCIEAVTA